MKGDDVTAQGTAVSDPQAPHDAAAEADVKPADVLLIEDLLVEDVSIDGMCGVY